MLEIYKSSAGSGKTFTLVKVYLKLALSGENINAYKNILAITFTNKAANEMKQRIVAAFADLAKNKAKDLSAILVDETGLDAETIQLKSQKILAHILHNYSDFNFIFYCIIIF